MTRLMICATLLAAGCATTPVKIVGPYANQLSHADVKQIIAMIVESEHYDHGSTTLEVVRPDKVIVNYVGYGPTIDRLYTSYTGGVYFIALKRNGRWLIDPELGKASKVSAH
jgi:hypothetical protein